MGNLVYCKKCRIPVKEFDETDSMCCGHKDVERDPDVYYHGWDGGWDSWNECNPDRPVDEDLIYGARKSPYMLIEEHEVGE